MRRKAPRAINENKVVQEINDETLIYDIGSHRAYCLNTVSSIVWRNCNGQNDTEAIARILTERLRSEVPDEMVWLALDQLEKAELVDSAGQIPAALTSVSRREAIRRVGLASAVALPMVASLVAPPAASAQSCIANNGTCTASSQCCSNCCKNVGGGINECKPGGGACLP
ncbi:MAG: PqqD family protein [Acidobacteriota bacterium]|nr:MAG: PqqD family protein [Acidobacteriota bacterium]